MQVAEFSLPCLVNITAPDGFAERNWLSLMGGGYRFESECIGRNLSQGLSWYLSAPLMLWEEKVGRKVLG
jgi:hypothetical protein